MLVCDPYNASDFLFAKGRRPPQEKKASNHLLIFKLFVTNILLQNVYYSCT